MNKSSIFRILLLQMLGGGGGVFGSRGTWNSSGAFEYYASPGGVKKSYSDSESICTSKGGELALVKSEDVQNFIETLVTDGSGSPYAFYIALRDTDGDGIFHWADGDSLAYTNWRPGEPNNVGDEKCVAMGQNYVYEGALKWNNQKCNSAGGAAPAGFVCHRKLGVTTQETPTTSQAVRTDLTDNATVLSTTNMMLDSNGTQSSHGTTEAHAHTIPTLEVTSQQTKEPISPNATPQLFTTSSGTSSSSSLLIPMIGVAAGGFILILIIVAMSVLICKRRASKTLQSVTIEMENTNASEETKDVRESDMTVVKRKKSKGGKNSTTGQDKAKPSSSTKEHGNDEANEGEYATIEASGDTPLPPPPKPTLDNLAISEDHGYAAVVMSTQQDVLPPPPPEEEIAPPRLVEEEGYSAIDLPPEKGAVQESEYTSMIGLRAEAARDAGYSKLNREGSVQIPDTTYAIMAPGPLSTPTDVKPMEVPSSGNSYDVLREHEKQLDDPESVYSLADQPPQQIVQADEPHIVEVPASPQTDESAQGNDPPMYAVVIKNSVKQ